MSDIIEYSEKVFEEIKHIDESGCEFWEARELQVVLEYKEWRNFKKVIDKSMITCKLSKINVFDHFVEFNKIVEAGATSKEIIDYRLSRYACYLIVQNGNSKKKVIALGQTYFAVQTRKMELSEEEFLDLSEDEKRLYTRVNVSNKNKKLFYTAKKSGVKDFSKFNNSGYMGLYNGETAKDIAKRKHLSENEEILDWMGSTELAANLFRITQTEDVLDKKKIRDEELACGSHYKVGKAVRNAIKEIGGTMPEELPTPNKSVKELEKEELLKLVNKN